MKHSTKSALKASAMLAASFVMAANAYLTKQEIETMAKTFTIAQENGSARQAYQQKCLTNKVNEKVDLLRERLLDNDNLAPENFMMNFQNALTQPDMSVTIEDISLCTDNLQELAKIDYKNAEQKETIRMWISAILALSFLGSAGTHAVQSRREKKKEAANNNPTPS